MKMIIKEKYLFNLLLLLSLVYLTIEEGSFSKINETENNLKNKNGKI